MMSPLIIAKTVLDTSKTYVITTSDQIALGVEKIIKEECKLLLNLDIPETVKDYAIGRFKADIERILNCLIKNFEKPNNNLL